MSPLPPNWIVVVISFINIAIAYGLNFSFSVFLVAILEEFGWSRAGIAGAFSLSCLILGVGSWPGGRLVDRFGPRTILVGGVFILAFSTIASGSIQTIWHLYGLVGVLAAIGICGLGWVPHSVLLSRWFVHNRGTMVGIAFSGMGVGILLVGPIAQHLISGFGWRMAYRLLGLFVLIVLLPLNWLQRNPPDQKEDPTRPNRFSSTPKTMGQFKRRHNESGDWTLTASMRTLSFWSLFFAFFLIPLGIYPIVIHQVAYIIDQGYSRTVAALIFGAVGFMSSAGRLIFGALSDRMGREKAVTLSFMCSIMGILILLFLPSLQSVLWLSLYVVLFGVSFGARGPIIAAMMADIYLGKHFGSIYGFVHIGQGIGGALGPWLGGYLYDLTGNYRIAFSICIPVLVLACILFWIARGSVRD
jgi:MFS family permease